MSNDKFLFMRRSELKHDFLHKEISILQDSIAEDVLTAKNIFIACWKSVVVYLLVESEPKCSSNVSGKVFDGDIVSFTCEVQYAGSIVPQMHWSSTISLLSNLDSPVVGSLNKISGTMKVERTDNGATFRCDTFFDEFTPSYAADARNKIIDEYKWTSEPFNVRCKCSLYSEENCIV